MSAATVSLPDMGEWNITSQIKIDGRIAPDFSFDWEVLFQGHKYIQPLRKPQGAKENTTLNSVIDLTFQHWAIYQLKRFPFVTMQPIDSGTAVADEEVATVSLNLGDFIILFAQVLAYYYGDKITIQLNPDWQYKAEAEVITISHTKVWNVLIEVFYNQFGVRWQIEPDGSSDKYVIKVGYPTTEQSHIFEYGFQGGLMKVERQVQSEEICNILKGRGGEKNLPYRYFKNVDPENPSFKADPDWIEELANIYFANLMPATFRSYVQGWKAAHISKDPGYKAVGEANAYAPWAYRKGFTDTKFHPVEFVADEITINPEAGDKQVEILPGYSPFVKKDSSLAEYGPLLNSLDNNEDIYPTIQGVSIDPYGRIDEAIEVEPITSDDIEEAAENDAQITTLSGIKSPTLKVNNNARQSFTLSGTLTVEQGKTANLITDLTVSGRNSDGTTVDGVIIESYSVALKNKSTGATQSASGIPSGSYTYQITANVQNASGQDLNVTIACPTPKLQSATPSDQWTNKWRIWVKNLWQTSKQSGETDAQYAERVWRPILGDREGNEAKVVFASGMLAHEDYEFTITSIPKYERKLCKWQTVEGGKVVEHEYWSEWCIELGKSDAELDTLGVYLPSVMRQAKAGDLFLFIGIDMPHQYTVWGEERVDDWKKDNLAEKKDIKPTWVVQTDRVRLNGEGKEDALIRKLHPGDTLRLADKRFIEGDYETLYLSSLTYTYREPTSDDAALNPDVEIVLSDSYEVSANPVTTLQREVSALAKQVGSISNVEQIVRAVADKIYLRKDGLPDRSMSPTEFASLLTSFGFRSGMVGGAGWGFFKDENGNWVLETDRINVRQEMQVNNLVINQITARGGMIVESAANMEITRVEDTTQGYKCYFDQHEGTVANLFHVDDIAWNNRFTPENNSLKFYKRRVIEVGVDYVVLSKTYVNGSGIPAEGDVIVHFGNYTDKQRQYVKVRDVIGGGYERYIEKLNSVNAEGVEYYFVGRQTGLYNGRPRWFVGDDDGFIEWINGVLKIKGSLDILSTFDGKTLGNYIDDAAQSAADATKEELQKQIDGVIESFNGQGAPTLNNYPANEWTTDAERKRHDRDIYTDITPYVDDVTTPTSGQSWKWYYNSPTDYGWNKIADSEAVRALQLAQMSVIDTDVLYKQTNSRTDAPATPTVNASGTIINLNGWSTDAPDWEEGKYIWQTTYVKKGDGSATFSNPTCISGRNGTDVTITSQSVRYSTNHGEKQPADTTFTLNEVPTLSAGQYLWSRTEVMYSNGQSTKSYAVSRIGTDGSHGGSYTPNLLVGTEEGKLIPSNGAATTNYSHYFYNLDVEVDFKTGDKYALSLGNIENIIGNPTGYTARLYDINTGESISTVAIITRDNPTCVLEIIQASQSASVKLLLYAGTWGSTQGNQVRYTKPMLVKGDNPIGWSPAASEMIAPTIISTSVAYAKSTTNVQPADSAFIYTSIGGVGLGAGDYLWTKTEVAYSDGSSTKSYSVSRIGSDGADGLPGTPGADGKTPYVHYAYANSADGKTGFSTTYFKDALYVGVCTDYNQADPTDYKVYEWSRLRGEDGRGIVTVVEEYAIHTSGTTAPADSEFSTTIKTMTDAKPYLWNREKTTYTDNTSETTTAVVIGVRGQNGADGATVVSVTNYYLASAKASGVTTSTSGWVTDASHANATTSAEKPYLWNYEVTKWSKGADTKTDPHVVGKFGKDGITPRITEQYYLSTSSTQLLGGSWQDNKPTWIAGRYYWTRSKIDYGNGDVEYTEGICVTPENGTSVLAEYSADGTNWHPSYQTGDVWMHTGTDGKNWSTAIRIVGINGSSYTNNLLLNSDFSDNKAHWGFSTGVSIDNSITMDGRSSVLVNISGLSANSYRGITQDGLSHVNPSLMLKGGDVVTASVWAYSDNISSIDSGARLEIKCFDKDGNTLTQKNQPIVLTKNNEWQRFFYTRTLPEGTSRVQVFIYVVKNGKIWISSPKCELGENLDPQWTPAPSEMVGADGKYPKYQWALSTNSSTSSNIQDNEWKDSPLTAPVGWYVWMRMGMVTPPETEPQSYGTPIRLTGDKGEKGDSVYMLDLSNEVVGIACDANGNPTSELPTSKVSVYEGSHVSEDWTISLANNGLKGCTAILSNNTIILTKITEDVASVTVQASKSGYSTLTATMNLYKVKPGESGQNGEDAMVFSIYSDVDNITKSFSGELSPNRIRVGKQMTKGSSTAYTPMHNLYYQRIGEDEEEILGRAYGSGVLLNIDITDKTESVILTLKSQDNGSVLDSERIPVLTDASDIEIGTRNIALNSRTLTINKPSSVYSNNRVQLSQSLKVGEKYAISINGITCVGSAGPSNATRGRFMAILYNNSVSTSVGRLTNIDPNNPYGVIEVTANSGANPWLYLYAGDSETNTRLEGSTSFDINSIQFTKISLVRGNVFLRDWEKAPEDIEEEIKEAVGKFDYLADAMKEDAKFTGGLLLASTVSLGKNNTDYTSQVTWSGINGIYKEDAVGGGISAWYGGDMYDLAEYYDWDDVEMRWIPKSNVSIPGRIARGVDRMDGSGYRAGGNFWWDKEGYPYFIGGGIFSGQVIAGDKQGQRIELNPNQKSIDIYGETGSRVATHSGRIIPLSEAMPPETSGPGSSKAIRFNETFTSSSSEAYHYLYTYKITLDVNTPGAGVLRISVPTISLTAKTLPGQGNLSDPDAKVRGILYLKFYNGTELVNTVGLGGITATGTEQATASIPAKTVTENRAVTRVVVELECYATNSKGLQGQVTASAGTNMTSSFVAQWYRCEYGANGWVISYDSNNYAYMLIENGKLNFKVVSNGKTVISSD